MSEVRVAGVWMSSVANVADLDYSSTWGTGAGGCGASSWSMDLDPNATTPALASGGLVEIFDGASRIWLGILAEPARGEPWSLFARGLSSEAARYLCLDAAGKPNSVPDTSIDQAILRGLPWVRRATVSAAAFTTASETVAVNRLNQLLDAFATSVGKRWGVFADGVITVAADPTTPKWIITPGAGVMGVADDEYVSHLYGRYVSAVTGTPAVPSAWDTVKVGDDNAATRWGRAEQSLDLTPLGLLTSARATELTQARFNLIGARMGWTDPLEPTSLMVTTLGGVPARLSQIQAGDMARIHGVLDSQGNLNMGAAVDVVLGEVKYSDGADSIYLAPVGLVDRDFQSALTAPSPPEKEFAA